MADRRESIAKLAKATPPIIRRTRRAFHNHDDLLSTNLPQILRYPSAIESDAVKVLVRCLTNVNHNCASVTQASGAEMAIGCMSSMLSPEYVCMVLMFVRCGILTSV
jgi:hypothetical protein